MNNIETKCNEIFILIKIGMTLTEINTLTDNERTYLSRFFLQHYDEEQKQLKEQIR